MKEKSKRVLSLEKEFHSIIANFLWDDSHFNQNNINIIDVDIDESLSRANIYYVTYNEKEIKNNRKLEKKVKIIIVNHFGSKIKRIPEIVFKYDKTFQKARRINALIDEITKKENENI